MEIRRIMSTPAVCCVENVGLNIPAQLMWEHDLGMVPVVDAGGRLAGVITDRDICMATFTRGQAPQDIRVSEVMSRELHTIHADASLEAAEHEMSAYAVRRLPVVDDESHPIGVVSMNDLARSVATARRRDGHAHELVETLAAIGAHRAGSAQVVELPTDPRRGVL